MSDALVELCTNYADVEPTGRFQHTIVTHVRDDGSADCDGLERSTSRVRKALPADVERHVRERDSHCRVPGCNHRRRLQAHHLVPRDWGGTDSIYNLARVCPYHHRFLVPHGPSHLIGDPEHIDGLRLVREDELIDARAGPAP